MVELKEGEWVIMEEDCGEDRTGSGYLTLTNQRLVFEKGEARVATFSKRITQVAIDLPLSSITKVRTEGWLVKKVVIEASDPSGMKVYKFGVFSTGKWRDAVEGAMKGEVSSST